MMNRRNFLQLTAGVALTSAVQARSSNASSDQEQDRRIWLEHLQRIAEPVLTHLAAGTLKQSMPVECWPGHESDRRQFTYLEAFARLLCGLAPWLEVELPAGPERDLQERYASLSRKALLSACDPSSPDYLNFNQGKQPLVDSGFLSLALLRAPKALWRNLDNHTQKSVVAALQSSRAITPPYNNWLLFAASVEAALASVGAEWDATRVDYALRKHHEWYVGDGLYGDGPQFHWDYYNSFVIQPMLLEVLATVGKHAKEWRDFYPQALTHAHRYAAIQERLVSPDGSFPAIGRSITYRTGAFHLLAAMALRKDLPEGIAPGQVRAALTAVMEKTLRAPGTYDRNGWLQIGLCGHQPHLGEEYISTGSLYLCSTVFLPLGLGAADPFWAEVASDWTSRKLWTGHDEKADHAI